MFCEPYLYVTSLMNLYLYEWDANYVMRQMSGNNDSGPRRRPGPGVHGWCT